MATKTRVSLEEFLAMPETEPASELIDGEVIQKLSPTLYHGKLTSRLISLLDQYLVISHEGSVVNEVRHVNRTEERVFLPDINVTLAARQPTNRAAGQHGPVSVPPDFALEVVSPGDGVGRVLEEADFYTRSGTSLLWLVDPDTETITAYPPGEPPAVISAQPVLSDFSLNVGALFAVLHEYEFE